MKSAISFFSRRVALPLLLALMLSGCSSTGQQIAPPQSSTVIRTETAAPATPAPSPAPTVQPTVRPTAKPTVRPASTAQPTQKPTADRRRIDPNGKMIALTFDDGPHPKYTQRIAAALEKQGGRGTFFVVGDRAASGQQTLRRLTANGHQIGSHTWSHKNLQHLSKDAASSEVRRAQSAIRSAAGSAPRIIRPPYGATGADARAAIRDANLAIVNWSVDPEDWKSRDADRIVREVMKHAQDGSIVLMHDLYASSAEAVERLAPQLTRAGYQLVTVDELYRLRGDALAPGTIHFKNPK